MSIETNPSPSPSVETAVAPLARMLQIVHGSLVAGVTGFLAYVMWQGPRYAEDPDAFPLIPLGFAALCVVLSVVVPPLVRQSGLAALRGQSPPSVESLFGPFSAAPHRGDGDPRVRGVPQRLHAHERRVRQAAPLVSRGADRAPGPDGDPLSTRGLGGRVGIDGSR